MMKHYPPLDTFNTAPIGMLLYTSAGTIVSANAALLALLGYSHSELAERNILDLVHPDDRIPQQEANQRLFADNTRDSNYRLEQHFVSRQGKLIWCISLVSLQQGEKPGETYAVMQVIDSNQLHDDSHPPFFSAMEQINDIIGQATDIDEMLSNVQDAMLDIFHCDRAWLLYPCDPQAASFCIEMERTRPQWPGAMAIGKPIPLSPDTRETLTQALNENMPIRYDGIDGRRSPESIAASFGVKTQLIQAIHPRMGKPWLLGIHHCEQPHTYTPEDQRLLDGIGRRIADALSNLLLLKDLRESERKHRQLFETMEKGVLYLNGSGQVLSANRSAARILELSDDEILEQALNRLRSDAIYEDSRPYPPAKQPDILALKTGKPIRNSVLGIPKKSGNGHRWLLINAIPQGRETGNGINHIYYTFVDITKRRQADSNMRKLSQVVEQSPVSVVITDTEGTIQYVNTKFEHISGYSREEAIGQNPRIVKSGETPDEEYARLWQTITSGGEWRGELHNRRKNGELYWERVSISPIKDQDGRIINFLGLKEDISERKQAEEALRRAQKMDAIGQITGGIAHDFNNLLGIIIGNLDFLERLLWQDDTPLKHARTANKAALRAADLTKQLLGFSRPQAQNIIPTNINQLIQDMEELIARSVTPEVEINFKLDPDLWLTKIDQGDFEVALLNLIINARDAMPNGGRLSIQTFNGVLGNKIIEKNPTITPGDYVVLMVTDTGTGISAADMEHIFEPFFSTKPQGKGTGLGMSTVFGFCKHSAGMANVDSEPGAGTRVTIYLPRTQVTAQHEMPAKDKEATSPSGQETILVVDDEEDLAQLAQNYLEELGYNTFIAYNSREALELLGKHSNVDLLLSDVVMPGGMNGFELAEQAVKLRPALKVVLTSGYSKGATLNDGHKRYTKELLGKPYRKADLASRIRNVLDQK